MATLRIIGGAWVLDWREDGQRRRKVLGRVDEIPKRDVERVLKQKNLELSAGYRLLNPPSAPRFDEFATDYLLWHSAEYPDSHERIKQIVEQHLLPAFAFRALDQIKPRDVDAWKQRRLAPRDDQPKAATVTKELRTLKAMLNQAVAWELLPRSPIAHVGEPKALDSKPPRFYTPDELLALYEACHMVVNNGEGPQPNPVHAPMWRLYANTGMRRQEGLWLRRSWIGREAMKILSSEDERTKSGKWREIPLTDGARIALDRLPRDGDYVLPQITPPSMSRAFVRDATRAGLDGGMHCLRHTYISHLVMAGVPLRTVQILAGHSTIAVTEKYAHLTPKYLQDAGRAISL